MKQDRYKFHVIDSDGKVKVTITLSQPMSEFIKNGPDLKSWWHFGRFKESPLIWLA